MCNADSVNGHIARWPSQARVIPPLVEHQLLTRHSHVGFRAVTHSRGVRWGLFPCIMSIHVPPNYPKKNGLRRRFNILWAHGCVPYNG